MKELLLYMAKNLVDDPDAVTVTETSDEEGKVLEAIDVDIPLVQGDIRLDIVAALDDLNLQAVFFSNLFDDFHDLCVWSRSNADFERFVGRRRRSGLGRFGFAAAPCSQGKHKDEAENEGQRFFGDVHE